MTQSLVVTDGIHSSGKEFITLEGGQATQEDYKDGMRLCREKIKGVKAHPELHLVTAVKDNKNVSTNAPAAKGVLRKIPTFYCTQWGHIMKKAEEKAEVLMSYLPHSLKQSDWLFSLYPELEDRAGSRSSPAISFGQKRH